MVKKFDECSQVLLHGDDRNLLSKLSIIATIIDAYEMLMSVIEKHNNRWDSCDEYLHMHDSK